MRNDGFKPHSEEYLARFYREGDSRGRYKRVNLTRVGATAGESGKTRGGLDPSQTRRHSSAPRTGAYAAWIEANLIPGYRSVESVHAQLNALEEHNLNH